VAIRFFSVAPLLLAGALLPPARAQTLDLELSHVVNDEVVSTTHLTAAPAEVRGTGTSSSGASELFALLLRDPAGRFSRYERDLKNPADGMLLSRVTVIADEETLAFRERGPMGSRTRTVKGPGVDLVLDAAFPEVFIPFLLDASRKSLRILVLPDVEIKTVVVEDRDDGARYAAIPGGGITLLTDSSGKFAKLVLPGPEARTVVPSADAARQGPATTRDNRLVLESGAARLGATLALPAGAQPPHPAVVLLGDAGPRDRNGVGGGSLVPVLKLLADELAGRGVASIRADKRGVGESAGPDPDLAALVADARVLVDAVALHPAMAGSGVFVAGHGEGAVVAAEVARLHPENVAGVITLAGPARPLPEALESRLRLRLTAAGQLPEAIEDAVLALRAEIEDLKALPKDGPFGPGQALLRDIVRLDPPVQLAALTRPVLVLHGTADRVTPPSQVALMRAALAFSADRARFVMVDEADHELLRAPPSSVIAGGPEQGDVARRLHPRIPEAIHEFIRGVPVPERRPESR
jgi:pimeloyl-ACP methyl ester carboxylesterase